jgi:hypothetical protein
LKIQEIHLSPTKPAEKEKCRIGRGSSSGTPRPSETVCERKFWGDDTEEDKFFFIEVAIRDAAGGNKSLAGP